MQPQNQDNTEIQRYKCWADFYIILLPLTAEKIIIFLSLILHYVRQSTQNLFYLWSLS